MLKDKVTISKMVRHMLSDRCLSVLSVCLFCHVLSAMLVYSDQMAGWIKMKLGKQVGHLGIGHTVFDGRSSPSPKGAQPPIFRPYLLSVLWPNGWMDQDATWYGDRPRSRRHPVRWMENQLPPPK